MQKEYNQLVEFLKISDPDLLRFLPTIEALLKVSDPTTFNEEEASSILEDIQDALCEIQPLDFRFVINQAQKASDATEVLAGKVLTLSLRKYENNSQTHTNSHCRT